MFERFTDRARQVVVLAQDEAQLLKHNYIGTEHLLLGLLREEEGVARRVLATLEVELEAVRAEVARIVGPGETIVKGQIPFTPRAKKVLELSLREALSLRHNYIGTEHILLGLAREDEGVAARVLLGYGVDSETLRNAVLQIVPGLPRSQRMPPQWRRRRRKFKALSEARDEAIEDGNYDLARKLLELEIEERERAKVKPPAEEPEAGAA